MIIGMRRPLSDGLIDYEDGTPASTPQMANDVANFIFFMQRRDGHRRNDKLARQTMIFLGMLLILPIRYVRTKGLYRNLLSTRTEAYAIRDGLGYKHWKTGMRSNKAYHYRNEYWT
jgi:ubiquinol-cytochrome c reductase cytochrome c1 subunit